MTWVALEGQSWGRLRGLWTGCACLEGTAAGWIYRVADVETGRWPDVRSALEALWRRRRIRDDRPWAVGWLGYGACAALGGDLPCLKAGEDDLEGVLLIEPDPSDDPVALDDGRPGAGFCTVSSPDADTFVKRVEVVRMEIEAGRVYQANLCRRFTSSPWMGGLQMLFEAARGRREADYLSAMKWGGVRAGELVCASMEMLVRRRGTRLETRPIKGTRPRDESPHRDRELIRELENDPKERAELAMIVDLERNDLSRVARTGTVVVEDPGSVGSWSAVHHRVARVSAEGRPGLQWWDILAAIAPGGSVTGCPKWAAMDLLTRLEDVPRGPFTGALGVVSGDGDMEFALPIRTAWTGDGSLEMAAGCGVVWDSKALDEEVESRLKISRWLGLMEGATT